MRSLIATFALFPALAFSFASIPPEAMTCVESPFANDNFTYIKCQWPPHISKFVTPMSDYNQEGALLIPKYPTKKLKLKAFFNGYSATPAACSDWGFSSPDYIVTKNCPDHLPSVSLVYGSGVGTWGGPSEGANPYGWRIAALLKYASDNYNPLIDWGAGITLEGCSYGGATSILQSILMPDPWAKALITVVNACVPQTLMVNTGFPLGAYWRDASVQTAWGGFDWRKADIRTQATGRIYYRINGSPADTSVVFDTAFFADVCDAKRVACFGTWHNAGHNPTEPGVNLPFYSLYSGPDSEVRLDKPLVIFTHSTANQWGIRGFYNLGMEWHTAGITDGLSRSVVPVRYRRHVGMGMDIPDQPLSANVDITLRRLKGLRVGQSVSWNYGDQSGVTTADSVGDVTVNITMASSDTYTNLELSK